MTTAPTPEEFMRWPSDPDEDLDFDPELWERANPVLPKPEVLEPLVSIAKSLRAIADQGAAAGACTACEEQSTALNDMANELAELEALHDAKQAMIEEALKVCGKSVSKLAIAVRAVLEPVPVPSPAPAVGAAEPPETAPRLPATVEARAGEVLTPQAVQCDACLRYFVDQELLDRHACTGSEHNNDRDATPAEDADVEEWRAHARSLGYTGPDVDKANRSQIRTMLGIAHPEGSDS